MKKLKKKSITENKNITHSHNKSLFKPEIKSSRVTINSRVCNADKFNQLCTIIDNTKDYKNEISQYCFNNLIQLSTNYSPFLKDYKKFSSPDLNSWETQTMFQEIAGHYHETLQRYNNKFSYTVNSSKFNENDKITTGSDDQNKTGHSNDKINTKESESANVIKNNEINTEISDVKIKKTKKEEITLSLMAKFIHRNSLLKKIVQPEVNSESETKIKDKDKDLLINKNIVVNRKQKEKRYVKSHNKNNTNFTNLKDRILHQSNYELIFNLNDKRIELHSYLKQYKKSLKENEAKLVELQTEINADTNTNNSNKIDVKKVTKKDKINSSKNNDNNKETKETVKLITELNKKITSYKTLITICKKIKHLTKNNSNRYTRIVDLVLHTKTRLLSKVQLATYKTGTHTRSVNNGQISIVKDTTNGKYHYFLKIRKNGKLIGREPKNNDYDSVNDNDDDNAVIINQDKTIKNDNYKELLAQFNETNFIYLPIIFNSKKLKEINRTMETLLTKHNPQVLIKSEQLRISAKSRKIHIIFNYEHQNELGKTIEHNIFNKNLDSIKANELNTLGLDLNLKHNLIADSNGKFYDDMLKVNNLNNNQQNNNVNGKIGKIKSNTKGNSLNNNVNNSNSNSNFNDLTNKNNSNLKNISIQQNTKFVNNLNEIVLLQSKPLAERTEKEIYRYQKLLRINESLLKTYLSGLIRHWKSEGVLHLVMEDLNFINDSSDYIHGDVKIKFTRLSRLLRMGQIKHWVSSIATKQGLFTHWINPAYTSQECSQCHYINTNNRKKQELFTCTNLGCCHTENADTNAAKVVVRRYLNETIRHELGKDNVYLCSRIKPIYYKQVKTVVERVYNRRVVTELSPDKQEGLNKKKEAPSFTAG